MTDQVSTATVITTPKRTAPTTFQSISGFALPSVIRNYHALLKVSYPETSATAFCGTTGIVILDYQVLESEAGERSSILFEHRRSGTACCLDKGISTFLQFFIYMGQLKKLVAEHPDLGLHGIDGQCLRVWISCDRPSGRLKR